MSGAFAPNNSVSQGGTARSTGMRPTPVPGTAAAFKDEIVQRLDFAQQQYGVGSSPLPEDRKSLSRIQVNLGKFEKVLEDAAQSLAAKGYDGALDGVTIDFNGAPDSTYSESMTYSFVSLDLTKNQSELSRKLENTAILGREIVDLEDRITEIEERNNDQSVLLYLGEDHSYTVDGIREWNAALPKLEQAMHAADEVNLNYGTIELVLRPAEMKAADHPIEVSGPWHSVQLAVSIDEDPKRITSEINARIPSLKVKEAEWNSVKKAMTLLSADAGLTYVGLNDSDLDPSLIQQDLEGIRTLTEKTAKIVSPDIDYRLFVSKGDGPVQSYSYFDDTTEKWVVTLNCSVDQADGITVSDLERASHKAVLAEKLAPLQTKQKYLDEFVNSPAFKNALELGKRTLDINGTLANLTQADYNNLLVLGTNIAEAGNSVGHHSIMRAAAEINNAKEYYEKVPLFKERNVIVIANNELSGETEKDPKEARRLARLAKNNGDEFRFGREPLMRALEKEALSVQRFRPKRDGSDIKQVHDDILDAIRDTKPPLTVIVLAHGEKSGFSIMSSKLPSPKDASLGDITNEEMAAALLDRHGRYPALADAPPEQKDIVINSTCLGNNQVKRTNKLILQAKNDTGMLPIQISTAENELLGYSLIGTPTGSSFFNLLFAHMPANLTIGDLANYKGELKGSTNYSIRVPSLTGTIKIADIGSLILPKKDSV